mmetsp:Transcript_8823/g.16747  ORF Transcript_8823/g.16747 Transcript_8823/m.16747 type:complete len:85 (-) Transcript_8823:2698-2952(-)
MDLEMHRCRTRALSTCYLAVGGVKSGFMPRSVDSSIFYLCLSYVMRSRRINVLTCKLVASAFSYNFFLFFFFVCFVSTSIIPVS